MSHKKYNSDSPIVEEIREAQKALWEEYGNDVNKICEAMRVKDQESRLKGVKFADDLKPSLPKDFHKRVAELRQEKQNNAA